MGWEVRGDCVWGIDESRMVSWFWYDDAGARRVGPVVVQGSFSVVILLGMEILLLHVVCKREYSPVSSGCTTASKKNAGR